MKYCFIILLSIVVCNSSLSGMENRSELLMKQKRFVRELYFERRYFDAIAETKRLIALDSGADAWKDYTFFIDVNYFLGGQLLRSFQPIRMSWSTATEYCYRNRI
jgi:hypothetical protein